METKWQQLKEKFPDVSRETYEDLLVYESLIKKWQNHINLISPHTLSCLWERHILDSAQLFFLQKEACLWLDIGSGGGLPGLVLAIFLKNQARRADTPPRSVHLVESNHKKAAFLQTVVRQLQLPAHVHSLRIETFAAQNRPEQATQTSSPLQANQKNPFSFAKQQHNPSLEQKGAGLHKPAMTEGVEKRGQKSQGPLYKNAFSKLPTYETKQKKPLLFALEENEGLFLPEIITARALAPLDTLFSLCADWLSAGSCGLFPKGISYEEELQKASKNWTFCVKKYKSCVEPESVILKITQLKKK